MKVALCTVLVLMVLVLCSSADTVHLSTTKIRTQRVHSVCVEGYLFTMLNGRLEQVFQEKSGGGIQAVLCKNK